MKTVLQRKSDNLYIGNFWGYGTLKSRMVKKADDAKHYQDMDSAKRAINHMCLDRTHFRLIKVPNFVWEK